MLIVHIYQICMLNAGRAYITSKIEIEILKHQYDNIVLLNPDHPCCFS